MVQKPMSRIFKLMCSSASSFRWIKLESETWQSNGLLVLVKMPYQQSARLVICLIRVYQLSWSVASGKARKDFSYPQITIKKHNCPVHKNLQIYLPLDKIIDNTPVMTLLCAYVSTSADQQRTNHMASEDVFAVLHLSPQPSSSFLPPFILPHLTPLPPAPFRLLPS